MEIKDAVAVVTGGTSGLGLATTRRLLDAGAHVVALDLKGEEVLAELDSDRVQFAGGSVTDEVAVAAALDAAESLGPLRIVVNCAGVVNADEYAALAVHIVENPMLNGEVIRLDGAIRMAPR